MSTTTLQRELGVAPGPATDQAYKQLLSAEARLAGPTTIPVAWPLVGREQEWTGLWAVWQAVTGSRSRLVLVFGEVGIGTTRLVEKSVV